MDNQSIINQYFDHVYVLNLDKRPDRKVEMLQKLNRLGISAEFVDAINGYSNQNIKEHQQYLNKPIGGVGSHELELKYKRKLIKSPGAWGCLKTFFGIINDAKQKGYERILCFEDDVVFHKDFENEIKRVSNEILQDWKLLYLGASQYVWNIPNGLSYPTQLNKTLDQKKPFYHPNTTDGAFAIGIDSSVFDVLKEEILKMNCPFDSGPLRTVIKLYPKKCFVVNPNIVIADVSDSDIRHGQNQQELATQLKWDLPAYDFEHKQSLVSIIMPAFNAANSISKAIQSILLQSYSNIELIVVNDASTDNTEAVVKRLIKKDSRIQLVNLEKNKGVGGARNEGIKIAKGNYIAFQDADDVSLTHRIAKQLVPILAKDVLFTASRFYRSRCKMEELNIGDQEAMLTLVESRRKLNRWGEFDYIDQANIGLVSIVYKKEVFENYGLFDELRYGEDIEYLERVIYAELQVDFNNNYNGHSYLNANYFVPKIYQRIDDVLLLCSEMTDANLTVQFESRSSEIKLNAEKFRSKYRLESINLYPKLTANRVNQMNLAGMHYDTLTLDEFVMLPKAKYQFMLGQLEVRNKTKSIKVELKGIYKSIVRIFMLMLGKFPSK